ncbi:hypothetical protein [Pseudaquabacterium pictum]|uniref:Uncharacterized protein n=1 Tax=Pseudaquabacterium pictum TaxID=2315236 RepID=A0A480AM01_9BURK|nr:hypothetical protein [Rubrivivax pictus]GCL61022.1 hypothetical protein AQPW35_01030 [Rubrivivax pictus]
MATHDAIGIGYGAPQPLGSPDSLSRALAEAIGAACAARGDNESNRAALLAECLQLDAAGQADMLEHFRAEAQRFGAGDRR